MSLELATCFYGPNMWGPKEMELSFLGDRWWIVEHMYE